MFGYRCCSYCCPASAPDRWVFTSEDSRAGCHDRKTYLSGYGELKVQ